MGSPDEVRKNIDAQVQLYGEPLSALLRRCVAALSITQSRLADLLGVSAPMLSQLINGHRVKLGNPAAVQRLQLLRETLLELEDGRISTPEAVERLERNRDSDVFTATTHHDSYPIVREIQQLFRAAASASDHLAAAAALRSHYPDIAELLRTYGAGRTDEALALHRQLTSGAAPTSTRDP